jgi:HD superfamily phosphodiesterase
MPPLFIEQAEKKYRKLLTEECHRLFSDMKMPSHDHHHHERVWENASQLLTMMYEAELIADPVMAEKAIIASFFHDTGLTLNQGADHGAESRQLCSLFLENTDLGESDRNEILEAVEKHDDKDYPAMSDPASLAAIISVADDMDAFGAKGIERYTEIYTMRGVTEENLPQSVIINITSRFRHLESTYVMFPDLVEEQKMRADTVIQYFKNKKDEKD